MSDAAGLLSTRAPSPGTDQRGAGTKRKIPERSERRVKLRDGDSVANLFFQPWEKSALVDLQPMDLWNHAKEGDDYAAFHTELAASDATGGHWRPLPCRCGAEPLCRHPQEGHRRAPDSERPNKQLEDSIASAPRMGPLEFDLLGPSPGDSNHSCASPVVSAVKDNLWKRMDEDARSIEGSLDVLDFGEGSQVATDARLSLKSLRRTPVDAAVQHTEAEIKAAAVQLHVWPSKPATALWAMPSILAGGGSFFAANAAEMSQQMAVPHLLAPRC